MTTTALFFWSELAKPDEGSETEPDLDRADHAGGEDPACAAGGGGAGEPERRQRRRHLLGGRELGRAGHDQHQADGPEQGIHCRHGAQANRSEGEPIPPGGWI